MNNKIYEESNPLSIDFFVYTINKYKKYVGNFRQSDKRFRKDISTQHIFHEANSFGIDAGLIPRLDELDCQRIILTYNVTGDHYSSDYKIFLKRGWQYPQKDQKVREIFQPSWVMDKKWWQIRDKFGNITQEQKEVEDATLSTN